MTENPKSKVVSNAEIIKKLDDVIFHELRLIDRSLLLDPDEFQAKCDRACKEATHTEVLANG